jgi:hypothetical protein
MTQSENPTYGHKQNHASVSHVKGHITSRESRRGIPGLIVEAYDVDYPADEYDPAKDGIRLGAVATDAQGAFEITFPAPTPNRSLWRTVRPVRNLRLLILAPEGPKTSHPDRLLYATDPRPNASAHEEFIVRLPDEALERAGIPAPLAAADRGERGAASLTEASEAEREIKAAADELGEKRLKGVLARRRFFRETVRPALEADLTSVTDEERVSGRYISPTEDIHEAYLASMAEEVEELAGEDDEVKPRRRTRFLLTEEQAKNLIPEGATEPVAFTEAELEAALGGSLDIPPVVYRRGVFDDPCRPRPGEDCLEEKPEAGTDETPAEGGETEEQPPPSPEEESDVAGEGVEFDKSAFISRLLERMTAPEDPVEFGAAEPTPSPGSRLTPDRVAEAVSALNIEPGPADIPALYDFHDLQIAFEPVWQEALDDAYLDDVAAAYDRFVELGGDSAEGVIADLIAAGVIGKGLFLTAFTKELEAVEDTVDSQVPAKVAAAVLISLQEWQALPPSLRNELEVIGSRIALLRSALFSAYDPGNFSGIIEALVEAGILDAWRVVLNAANDPDILALRTQIRLLTSDAERIVAHARRLILEREADKPFRPTHKLIKALRKRGRRAYPFRYFAANTRDRSVNFGILVTYRQTWTPIAYQVGELVSTIPLAPKEIRKFTKKTVVKTTRSRKEVVSNISSRSDETAETGRAEAQIVAKAHAKTNFSMTTEGSVTYGIESGPSLEGSQTSTFGGDAERHSESVKKEFREAIFKSAQEFKSERKVEVSTEETFEEEITESGEIQNPNEEIPVTFLFYELQRRFRLSEKIHRLRSVVLVAQEMPSPGEIDEDWLIEYDWILNRVLLDDSFRPALTYISTSLVSENIALREMRDALFRHRKLVEELKEEVADRRSLAGLRYAALQRQIERTARSADDGGGGLFGVVGDLAGGLPGVGRVIEAGLDLLTGSGDGPSEAAQIREAAARDAFDRERREEEELVTRLQQALSTLEALQRQYTERLAAHLREITQVERLKVHVRQNILHYMQAIWAHEPEDQRYLRLRNVPVPVFEKKKNLKGFLFNPQPMKMYSEFIAPGAGFFDAETDSGVDPADDIQTRPLSEVADLDNPLGFKGNYMIFPLVESNPITEFMMDPYVALAAGEYGLSDPDLLGNMSLAEFADYVCCLREELQPTAPEERDSTGDSSSLGSGSTDDVAAAAPDPFEEVRPFLEETLQRLLESPLRENEEIIVPTDSLYIEALPGAHPILEDFKLLHRAIDVKLVQAEVRSNELDNIRRAARILAGDFDDPDADRRYVFEGGGSPIVGTEDESDE